MTDDDLKRARELCDKATSNLVVGVFHSEDAAGQIEQFAETVRRGTGRLWCVCCPVDGKPIEAEALYAAITGNGPTSEANARFIAAARTGWPEALDEIERLRACLARANANHEDFQDARLATVTAERDAFRESWQAARAEAQRLGPVMIDDITGNPVVDVMRTCEAGMKRAVAEVEQLRRRRSGAWKEPSR